MRLAVIMGAQKKPKTACIPFLGTTGNLVETKALMDQITKWYMTSDVNRFFFFAFVF